MLQKHSVEHVSRQRPLTSVQVIRHESPGAARQLNLLRNDGKQRLLASDKSSEATNSSVKQKPLDFHGRCFVSKKRSFLGKRQFQRGIEEELHTRLERSTSQILDEIDRFRYNARVRPGRPAAAATERVPPVLRPAPVRQQESSVSATKRTTIPSAAATALARRRRPSFNSDVTKRYPNDFTEQKPFQPQILRTCMSPRLRYMRNYRGPIRSNLRPAHADTSKSSESTASSTSSSQVSVNNGGPHDYEEAEEEEDQSESSESQDSCQCQPDEELHSQSRQDSFEGSLSVVEEYDDEDFDQPGSREEHRDSSRSSETSLDNDDKESCVSSKRTLFVPPLALSPDSVHQELQVTRRAAKHRPKSGLTNENNRASSKDSAYNGGYSSSSRGPTPDDAAPRSRSSHSAAGVKHRPGAPSRAVSSTSQRHSRNSHSEFDAIRDSTHHATGRHGYGDVPNGQCYVNFLADVTSDMITEGTLTIRSTKQIIAANVDKYHRYLNTEGMHDEAERLCQELGIPLHEDEVEDGDDEAETTFSIIGSLEVLTSPRTAVSIASARHSSRQRHVCSSWASQRTQNLNHSRMSSSRHRMSEDDRRARTEPSPPFTDSREWSLSRKQLEVTASDQWRSDERRYSAASDTETQRTEHEQSPTGREHRDTSGQPSPISECTERNDSYPSMAGIGGRRMTDAMSVATDMGEQSEVEEPFPVTTEQSRCSEWESASTLHEDERQSVADEPHITDVDDEREVEIESSFKVSDYGEHSFAEELPRTSTNSKDDWRERNEMGSRISDRGQEPTVEVSALANMNSTREERRSHIYDKGDGSGGEISRTSSVDRKEHGSVEGTSSSTTTDKEAESMVLRDAVHLGSQRKRDRASGDSSSDMDSDSMTSGTLASTSDADLTVDLLTDLDLEDDVLTTVMRCMTRQRMRRHGQQRSAAGDGQHAASGEADLQDP